MMETIYNLSDTTDPSLGQRTVNLYNGLDEKLSLNNNK
jgi:hypothetical protein